MCIQGLLQRYPGILDLEKQVVKIFCASCKTLAILNQYTNRQGEPKPPSDTETGTKTGFETCSMDL